MATMPFLLKGRVQGLAPWLLFVYYFSSGLMVEGWVGGLGLGGRSEDFGAVYVLVPVVTGPRFLCVSDLSSEVHYK